MKKKRNTREVGEEKEDEEKVGKEQKETKSHSPKEARVRNR